MTYLVRKFSNSKWINISYENPKPVCTSYISADAFTSCLRTKDNTLSFWEISDIKDTKELNEIVMALALNSNTETLSSFDILFFEKNEDLFNSLDLKFEKTEGDTFISECQNKHLDLINLNYSNMTELLNKLCEYVNNDQHQRFTKSQIKKLLQAYYKDNPNEQIMLNEDLRKEIGIV